MQGGDARTFHQAGTTRKTRHRTNTPVGEGEAPAGAEAEEIRMAAAVGAGRPLAPAGAEEEVVGREVEVGAEEAGC
jgi:hypothetical protein